MTAPVTGHTPNFGLALPYGTKPNWTDLVNNNTRIIDALIASYVHVANLQGLWLNSTVYTIGMNVVDPLSGVVYTAQVNHTSSSTPTTFLQERTNHPTYWLTFATAARNRGAWTPNTVYALNDFVLGDGNKYAMCVQANTSSAAFSTDLALGYWSVMIDLSIAGSLVLPVLGGVGDANKAVMTNAAGNAYIVNTMAVLAALLNAAGLATLANPTFTGNVTVPAQAVEAFNALAASTLYADRAVRNLVMRFQIVTGTGTFTPNAKALYTIIGGVAGGAAGGAGFAGAAGTTSGAGGGGAGGFSASIFSAATLAAAGVLTANIGAAGAGGAGTGGNGGTTSLVGSVAGTLLLANGGSGGTSSNSGAPGLGGGGGILAGAVGDFKAAGAAGSDGNGGSIITFQAHTGAGGNSVFGGGAASISQNNATGPAATAFGGGGGGGQNYNSGPTTRNGGNGFIGIMIAVELCYG